VDEVLYFVLNKYDNTPTSTLRSVICELYKEDEVVSAKQNLLQHIGDAKAIGVTGYIKKRIGDNKLKATVDDIVGIVTAIDERGIRDTLPVFCSVNALRIPTVPDEMSDLAAIRHEVHSLKDQFDARNVDEMSDLCALHKQLHQVKQELSSLSNKLHSILGTNQTMTKYAPLSLDEYPVLPNREAISMDNAGPSAGSASVGCTSIRHVSQSVGDSHSCETAVPNNRTSEGTGGSHGDTDMDFADALKRPADNDGFQPVTHKRNKNRTKVIVGNSTAENKFSGIVRRSVVCVNRLDSTVTPQLLTDFLKDNGINVFTCFTVNMVDSHNTIRRRNFTCMRVCVAYPDLEKMYNSEMWPLGVVVRPWSFKKKESAQGGN